MSAKPKKNGSCRSKQGAVKTPNDRSKAREREYFELSTSLLSKLKVLEQQAFDRYQISQRTEDAGKEKAPRATGLFQDGLSHWSRAEAPARIPDVDIRDIRVLTVATTNSMSTFREISAFSGKRSLSIPLVGAQHLPSRLSTPFRFSSRCSAPPILSLKRKRAPIIKRIGALSASLIKSCACEQSSPLVFLTLLQSSGRLGRLGGLR
jgi:hypothetical protein